MKSYIYLYTYIYSYLVILLCTAEDPAEDTLQSRALTTNAIAKYAAKGERTEDLCRTRTVKDLKRKSSSHQEQRSF